MSIDVSTLFDEILDLPSFGSRNCSLEKLLVDGIIGLLNRPIVLEYVDFVNTYRLKNVIFYLVNYNYSKDI